MVEKKTVQEKLIRYQILENKANALMKRRELLISKMIEIESTLNSVDELEKSGGEDILLPIGANIHAIGQLKKVDKMIVEIGADTAIESTVKKAKEIIEKRKKILEDGLTTLEGEIVSIGNELVRLQPEINAMLSRKNKPSSEITAG